MTLINSALSFKHFPYLLLPTAKVSLGTNQAIIKVFEFAQKYFGISSSAALTIMGSKVIWIDKPKSYGIASPFKNPIERLLNNFRSYVEIEDRKKYVLQGIFFVGCGVTSATLSFHDLGLFDLGRSVPFLNFFSNGSFLLAHLLALELNVKNYHRALNTVDAGESRQLKLSSLAGILSNLNYIFFATLSLLGVGGAITLVFGCVGCFFGCIKILVDFLKPHLSK